MLAEKSTARTKGIRSPFKRNNKKIKKNSVAVDKEIIHFQEFTSTNLIMKKLEEGKLKSNDKNIEIVLVDKENDSVNKE